MIINKPPINNKELILKGKSELANKIKLKNVEMTRVEDFTLQNQVYWAQKSEGWGGGHVVELRRTPRCACRLLAAALAAGGRRQERGRTTTEQWQRRSEKMH